METRHNVLLLGLGYHARRIHVPVLKMMPDRASLLCVVDLEQERTVVTKYLEDQNLNPETVFLDPKIQRSKRKWRKILDSIVTKHDITSVLIATEPLAHYDYIIWALDRGLNILLDKPISTSKQIANSCKVARNNLLEYQVVEKKYKKLLAKKNLVFTVLAQRRFHPAYDVVRKAVSEVFEKTNCPVTMQVFSHSDGQWRFPDEIIEQDYHPYNSGYGKLSHSGYHFVDLAGEISELTHRGDKTVDEIEIFAQVSRPTDFLSQLSIEDHKKLIQDTGNYFKYVDRYEKMTSSFGEVDVTANITFKQKMKVITLSTLNLAHTGYSRRNWPTSEGRDLYKGNGRVRQEQHLVEQGPFQSIFVSSLQSKEILEQGSDPFRVGGEDHLEVTIFRNNKLFPDWKAVETINVKDIMGFDLKGYSRGHQEEARKICIESFFDYIEKAIPVEQQRSNFLQHKLTAQIFSGIYQSIAAKNHLFSKRIVRIKK